LCGFFHGSGSGYRNFYPGKTRTRIETRQPHLYLVNALLIISFVPTATTSHSHFYYLQRARHQQQQHQELLLFLSLVSGRNGHGTTTSSSIIKSCCFTPVLFLGNERGTTTSSSSSIKSCCFAPVLSLGATCTAPPRAAAAVSRAAAMPLFYLWVQQARHHHEQQQQHQELLLCPSLVSGCNGCGTITSSSSGISLTSISPRAAINQSNDRFATRSRVGEEVGEDARRDGARRDEVR
jgi:hypothetical protein